MFNNYVFFSIRSSSKYLSIYLQVPYLYLEDLKYAGGSIEEYQILYGESCECISLLLDKRLSQFGEFQSMKFRVELMMWMD